MSLALGPLDGGLGPPPKRKKRKKTDNTFCSTGKGGGIDPHCGEDGRGAKAVKGVKRPARMAPGSASESHYQASDHEFKEARKIAKAKITEAPVPTKEAVKKARDELAKAAKGEGRAGGESRGGSSADRRRQRQNLFKEFGGEKRGYIVCWVTGLKMHWSKDPKDNPKGYPLFERGKIFVKSQGGGYQLPNLVPESFTANRTRSNRPVRKENLK